MTAAFDYAADSAARSASERAPEHAAGAAGAAPPVTASEADLALAAARGLVPRFGAPPLDPSAILDVLGALSTRAELAAVASQTGAARAAVLLFAETARALHALLTDAPASAPAAADPALRRGERRANAAVVRVARMEQWLSARAEHDHAAQPAADLCLWVLEHLDH